MDCERVWVITARTFVKENVESIVKELEAKGFKVEKREIIFEYDNL